MASDDERLKRLRRAMYSRSVSKHLKPEERRHMQQSASALPDDWEDDDEDEIPASRVAPRSITVTRSALWWVLGAAVVFFLIAVGAFVYYFTVGPGGGIAAPRNIDISVQGPLTVAGGEPVELQITVANRNQAALELADLILTYPPGTRSPSDFGTSLPRQRIPLGDIESGGQRQGKVSAVFVGQEGESAEVLVELEYRLQGSSAIFVADTTYEVRFASSPVSLAVEANDEAISGQRMVLTATISSNADVVVRDAVLEASYPFGFEPTATIPEATARDAFWELGDIHPGDEIEIRVEGTLEGQEQDERVFTFTLGTREDTQAQRVEVPLAEVAHRIALARPFIGLSVVAGGRAGTSPVAVNAGETVNVSIPWQNNLGSSISDLVLVAQLTGFSFEGRQVRVEDGFYRSSDRTLIWDKTTTRGDFTNIEPGESGRVTFSFQVPPEEDTLALRDADLKITVNAAARRGTGSVPETLQASVSRTVNLGTTVHFLANAFYRANPFGSVGPLPPQVNEETTYAVVWTVANTSNTVTEGEVRGVLPSNVRWLGVYSPRTENIEYVADDGTIIWKLGEVDPGVGVGGSDPRQVAFAVGLTPSATQTGSDAPLMVNQAFRGVDEFTGEPVNEEHANVTTDLESDPNFDSDEGEVVQ